MRYADLLDQLSPDLHGRVMLHTYGKWLSVVPFFNMRTDHLASTELYAAEMEFKGFIMGLAVRVKPVLYAPLEAVLRSSQCCSSL